MNSRPGAIVRGGSARLSRTVDHATSAITCSMSPCIRQWRLLIFWFGRSTGADTTVCSAETGHIDQRSRAPLSTTALDRIAHHEARRAPRAGHGDLRRHHRP